MTVAKLKPSDFLQDHRRLAVNKGQSVNGEVIIEMFKTEIEDDHKNKPRTKLYKREVLTALKKSWPDLYWKDIAKISQKDCNDWATRYGKEYILWHVFVIGINERPNFIALNPFAIQVAKNFVLIRGAGRAKLHQQLLNRRAMDARHADSGAERVALNQTGNHADLFFLAQFIHASIMLERSSKVNDNMCCK